MSSHVFLKVIVFATAFLLINPLVNTKEVMMKLTSPAFTHQAMIPKKYTCQGEDISPPLTLSNIPIAAIRMNTSQKAVRKLLLLEILRRGKN